MAGRPPLPSNVHAMRGTRSQVGRGARGAEPDPSYVVDLAPPAHLPDSAKAVWSEFAPRLAKNHLLSELDTFALEALCISIARYRRLAEYTEDKLVMHNAETGNYSISPHVLLQQMYANQADRGMAKFGMTPADRVRVLVNPQDDLFAPSSGAAAQGASRFFS